MSVDDLLERNRGFVRERAVRPLPPPETVDTVILACYDPRLDALLRPALGLESGQAFLMRSAGAAVGPTGDPLRSIALAVYLFNVSRIIVVGHTSCRMATFDAARFADAFRSRGVARSAFGDTDLRSWAAAIPDPARGVRGSVAALRSAPCLPPDLSVSGLLLDDASGGLSVVIAPDQAVDGRLITPAPGGLAAERDEPALDAAASTPAVTALAPPAPAFPPTGRNDLVEAARGLIDAVSAQSVWRVELQRLRTQLHNQTSPAARLRLIDGFLRKAAADSREVADAFDRLVRAGSATGTPDRTTLIDLVRRIFLGEKP